MDSAADSKFNPRQALIVAALGACIYLLSFFSFSLPWLNLAIMAAILVAAGWLSWQSLEFGAYILIAELALGGMGYLWSWPFDGARLSLRLGLFVVVLSVWLIKSCPKIFESKAGWIKNLKDWRIASLLALLSAAAMASIAGLAFGHPFRAVFNDANGYLYLALAGAFWAGGMRIERFKTVIFGVSIASAGLTAVSLFVFSHGWAFVGHDAYYKWIRDAGIGEITLISAPLFRIFFQSHIYNLLALILAATDLIAAKRGSSLAARVVLWVVAFANIFTLVISQSRSLWLAGIIALFLLLPYAAWRLSYGFKKTVAVLAAFSAFLIISNFAGQLIIGDFGTDFFTGRVGGKSGAPAVSSRIAELNPAFDLIRQSPVIGNGFGQTVRFRSDDPRIKNASNPEGWTDAAMIEWGYLDLAVKAGIVGLAALIFFIWSIGWTEYKRVVKGQGSPALILSLIMLIAVNMFTPYLNHPLGLGLVLSLWSLSRN